MASTTYLDSSAIVKLVVAESESGALQTWLRANPSQATCGLARTEVIRAVRGVGPHALARARSVLRRLQIIALDDGLLDRAGFMDPAALRSLDAIHLAAALDLGDDLSEIVTYDRRMIEGATALGLPTASPG